MSVHVVIQIVPKIAVHMTISDIVVLPLWSGDADAAFVGVGEDCVGDAAQV